MTFVRFGRWAPLAALTLAPAAGAQPAPTPAPAPTPVVITMGADGKPTVSTGQAEAGPTGYYHYDDALAATDETIELHSGPTPELHVVTRGDTLWAICWYYFNDPWQWPKVWSYNPQITNPHWIYPGDLVRLLPKGWIQNVQPVDTVSIDPDDPDAGTPPEAVTPQRAVALSVRQVAFIDQKHLDSAWRVVGAVDDRELLSLGDEIYVSYPKDDVPQVGKRYSIYATDQGVTNPNGGGKVGSYVRVLGDVEIVAVKKDKEARGRIVSVSGEIERGARVGPLLRQFKSVPPVKNAVDATGTIVAMLTRDQMIGEGEVVFLDLGKASGVQVGNRLVVVRRGDAFDPVIAPEDMVGQNNQKYPTRTLGEIALIQVDEKLSVGLVTLAIEEMGVGDRVMMRKQ